MMLNGGLTKLPAIILKKKKDVDARVYSLATWQSLFKDFPVAQTVKNLPAIKEIGVQSLGQEDSLEKGTAIHSSILAGRIPWTEKPGGLQSMGLQRVGHD